MVEYEYNPLRLEAVIKEIVMVYHIRRELPPEELTRDRLQKLCYLADFAFYERYEISLTGETYVHGRNGPIGIHFEKALRELITDDRISVDKNSVVRPYLDNQTTNESMRVCRLDASDEFIGKSRHILPELTEDEMEVISQIVSGHMFMKTEDLEEFVKSDLPWITAPEGQALDYRFVFYRKSHQEADDDD